MSVAAKRGVAFLGGRHAARPPRAARASHAGSISELESLARKGAELGGEHLEELELSLRHRLGELLRKQPAAGEVANARRLWFSEGKLNGCWPCAGFNVLPPPESDLYVFTACALRPGSPSDLPAFLAQLGALLGLDAPSTLDRALCAAASHQGGGLVAELLHAGAPPAGGAWYRKMREESAAGRGSWAAGNERSWAHRSDIPPLARAALSDSAEAFDALLQHLRLDEARGMDVAAFVQVATGGTETAQPWQCAMYWLVKLNRVASLEKLAAACTPANKAELRGHHLLGGWGTRVLLPEPQEQLERTPCYDARCLLFKHRTCVRTDGTLSAAIPADNLEDNTHVSDETFAAVHALACHGGPLWDALPADVLRAYEAGDERAWREIAKRAYAPRDVLTKSWPMPLLRRSFIVALAPWWEARPEGGRGAGQQEADK